MILKLYIAYLDKLLPLFLQISPPLYFMILEFRNELYTKMSRD